MKPRVALVHDEGLASYRFPDWHPLKPERFELAIDLMGEWGLLCGTRATSDTCATVIGCEPITSEQISRVHTATYMGTVEAAGADPAGFEGGHGIGPEETPAFWGMHQAAALTCAATLTAMRGVHSGQWSRAFAPAGGMHHAHRDRAAGFCVYNDCAVAIADALASHPGVRIAYVDIDVHHGDGVQEAFADRADVLTVSIHETGAFRYPGTGFVHEMGSGAGLGTTMNIPLQPGSGPQAYLQAMARLVVPALDAFGPDIVLLQAGADSHHADPLATIENTLGGFLGAVELLIEASDRLCNGRIVVVGGGGYQPFDVVPVAWASLLALLLGVAPPASIPDSWVKRSVAAAGARGVQGVGDMEALSAELRCFAADPITCGTDASEVSNERVFQAITRAHPLLLNGTGGA